MPNINDWQEVPPGHPAHHDDPNDWVDAESGQPNVAPVASLPLTQKYLYKPEQINAALKNTASVMAGGGLGRALGPIAEGLAGATAESGAVGAAMSPDDRLKGFLTGGASALVPGAIAKGLKSGAENLIQRATGVREPARDIGRTLLDQNIVGTRGMMRGQVADKIAKTGEELGGAVSSIPGDVDTSGVIGRLRGEAEKLKINGQLAPNVANQAKHYTDLADFLQLQGGGAGQLSPQDLLKFKRQQGDAAYLMSGNPAQSDAAQAARIAMGESGDAIKNAYGAANPGVPNVVADTNKELSGLFKAKSGLKKGESLSGLASYGGLAGVGALFGGAPGAIAGAALKTPLVQSGSAHALDLLGNGADKIDPALLRSLFLNNPDNQGK